MEDFSDASFQDVRIHVNTWPLALGADAFTVGEHIYFAPGCFQPSSPRTARLLAHELTHVLQQRAGRVPLPPMGLLSWVEEPLLELEAELSAAAVECLPRLPVLLRRRLRSFEGEGQRHVPRRVGAALQCGYCEVSVSVHKTEKNKGAVIEFLRQLLAAVEKAYQFVLSSPLLGPYAELDGHTGLWVKKWEKYTSGKSQGGMASAFGYVIETLATVIFLPQAPPGMSIRLQEPCGPTRPDVVLVDDTHGTYVAWFDFTAKDSAGHIWKKIGWDGIDHVAEIVYPSTDMKTIQEVSLKGTGFKGEMDGFEVLRRLGFAKIINGYRKEHWKKLGLHLLPTPKRGGDPLLVKPRRKKDAAHVLAVYFSMSEESFMNKTGASVIKALGRDPETFGFAETASVVLGESFLLQHDPGQPRIEIPRLSVPRSIPVFEPLPLLVEPEPMDSGSLSLVPFHGSALTEGPSLFSTAQTAFTFTLPQQDFFSFQQTNSFPFSTFSAPHISFGDPQRRAGSQALISSREDEGTWRGPKRIMKLRHFLERRGLQRKLTRKQLNKLLRNREALDDPFLRKVTALRAVFQQRKGRYLALKVHRSRSIKGERQGSPFVLEFEQLQIPSLLEEVPQQLEMQDEDQELQLVGIEVVTQGEEQEEVDRLWLDSRFA